ncbi:rRNA maturation RNase YbeY [bacterium]|nr:rRNA maturation RNase YbeY [bacterium]
MSECHTSTTGLELTLVNRQSQPVDVSRLVAAALQIAEAQQATGSLTVTLVTDNEIHRINREFLQHDWPTDVISFSYHDDSAGMESHVIEGELVISVETACTQAEKHGWRLDDELLLYWTHGFLHLCGYDDLADEERPRMRQRERELLAPFGLCPRGLEE